MIAIDDSAGDAGTNYEELRSHVLAGSPGGPHSGAIVLLREGVAAWIERVAARLRVAVQPATPSTPMPALSQSLHSDIVHVLADIALRRREEIKA